jgi:hypothetical protein
MDDTETVTVPRWALEFVLDKADFCDAGPPGEGWYSGCMREAKAALEAALEVSAET